MTQGYTLLNDPLNAQSEAFVPLYSNAGAIINGSAACAAVFPQIQGFPTVVYQDASGNNHALYNPGTMEAVAQWRAAIDNPPAAPKPTSIPLAAFLERFTDAQLQGFQQAAVTDPQMQVIIWRTNTTPGGMVDLTNPVVQGYVNYAASKGYGGFTQAEATVVLTP
jgi:hypothetical protein